MCGAAMYIISVDTAECCGGEHRLVTSCGDLVVPGLTAGDVFVTIEAVGECAEFELTIRGP